MENGGRMMHEFRIFAIDSSRKGYPERKFRSYCVCGWLGEWTEEMPRSGLGVIRAAAQKQFMEHLERLQPYLENPMRFTWTGGIT